MTRADQRKFHYIYKITRNDGSGKYYIGMHSTDDLEDGYFGSGQLLWKSIKKHGKEKHSKEILEFLPSRRELKTRERELVNEEIVNDPLCMNLKLGGEGGWDHLTPEHHSPGGKIGGKINGLRNIKATNTSASITRRAATFKSKRYGQLGFGPGYKHHDETKNRMSKSQQGEKNSQFGTCWVTNGTPIKIKKEQLDEYLANGYRRGRK